MSVALFFSSVVLEIPPLACLHCEIGLGGISAVCLLLFILLWRQHGLYVIRGSLDAYED